MTTHQDQALADALRDVLDTFDRDGDGAIGRLEELYDPDVVFRDPLQTLHGRRAFIDMNRRILRRARHLAFTVHDAHGADSSAFLTWTMNYKPNFGPRVIFEGATHARIRDGKVLMHRDYWDLLSSVSASVPVLRAIYASVAPHLA